VPVKPQVALIYYLNENEMTFNQLAVRMKRLRQTPAIRDMLRETHLHPQQLIAPLFIHEGLSARQAIKSMPDHFQLTLADLESEIDELSSLGIQAVLLFGIPITKDPLGS